MLYSSRLSLLITFFAFFLSANSSLRAQDFVIYDNLKQLQSRISCAGDTALLINFWATWCKPCVEELPCFDDLQELHGAQKLQVLLVSLDFKSQVEKKFIPFLKYQQLQCEVALMADQDFDTWIPAIYEKWDGAIPATIIMKGKKNNFKLGKFEDFLEMEDFVLPFVADSTTMIIEHHTPCDISGGEK